MKVNLISVVLLFALAGCGKDKQSTDELVTINVSKDYPEKELILQDIMDVEYIALETTDEFITHGNVMDVDEKFIIVKNKKNGKSYTENKPFRTRCRGISGDCRNYTR